MSHLGQKKYIKQEIWAQYLRNALQYSFYHHVTKQLL